MTENDQPLHTGLVLGWKFQDGPVLLGDGIELRAAFAHVMSNHILAFAPPANKNSPHPGPWRYALPAGGTDLDAELCIPASYSHPKLSRYEVARCIVATLKLWCNPDIMVVLASKHRIAEMPKLEEDGLPVAAVLPPNRRCIQFNIKQADEKASAEWLQENWRTAVDLMASSSEFELALEAFETAQTIPNSAMMLVSLWGALEAIFSPSTSELRFRVSASIASYLEERGPKRLALQKEINKLYDKRSAAAHGKPKHLPDDILQSFGLIRDVILKMIQQKKGPTKQELEELLFC